MLSMAAALVADGTALRMEGLCLNADMNYCTAMPEQLGLYAMSSMRVLAPRTCFASATSTVDCKYLG